jgi:hypothetical protein
MPSWTTDDGNNLFGRKLCVRCLQWILTDEEGEIPEHKCLDEETPP